MTSPHDTQFDRDLALADTERPYAYTGSFDRRWYIDRALHGGHVISAIVRAFERAVADPARALRSITVHYVQPAQVGPYAIEVVIDRTGRSLSNVRAQIIQDRLIHRRVRDPGHRGMDPRWPAHRPRSPACAADPGRPWLS